MSGGCAGGLDNGFGVALTVRADTTVDAATLARVVRLQVSAGGDEGETVGYDFARPAFVHDVERVVFRPLLTTRALRLGVTVFDAAHAPLAAGATGTLTLRPGETTTATVTLTAGAPAFDLAAPPSEDAAVDAATDGGTPDGPRPARTLAFAAPRALRAGMGVLAAGDVDGDGKIDLVGFGAGGLAVLRGRGDGQFDAAAGAAINAPVALGVGDFNGDGRSDAAVLLGEGKLYVLLAAASGFAPPVSYAAGASPTALAVGDLNGDGKPDLAFTNAAVGVSRVSVLLNNGNGTFAAPVPYATAQLPYRLAIGDLSGDGKPDLIVGQGDGTVALFVNGGGGTFGGAPIPIGSSGHLATALAAADLDGNGSLDVLVGRDNPATIDLLFNQGGNTFTTTSAPVGAAPLSPLARDFDGDGKIDLALATNLGLTQLAGAGAGGFAAPTAIALPSTASAAAGDFDGDGDLDLALGNGDGDVVILLNDGHAGLLGGLARVPAALGGGGAAVDLDGDGRTDLVGSSDHGVTAFHNDGKGGFAAARTTALPNTPTALTVADLNGDGKPDVAVADPNPSALAVEVLLNDGSGALGGPLPRAIGVIPNGLASGDFDDDHKTDLVVSALHLGLSGAQGVAVLPNPSNNGMLGPPVMSAISGSPTAIAAADLDGDGKPDVAVTDFTTGRVEVLVGQGGGSFAAAVPYAASGRGISAADLNGDGRPDLVVTNDYGANVAVLLNQGKGVFGTPASFPTANGPLGLAIADLDGDGILDLAVAHARHSEVALLRGRGDGSFMPGPIYAGCTAPFTSLAAADLDGDGRVDLALFGGDALVVLRNTTQ
jgi:hypothetical protein